MSVSASWRSRLAVGSAVSIVSIGLAGLVSVGAAPQAPPASAAPIAITVDAAKPGPVLSRHLFGQFAEHLGKGIYEGIWVGPDSPIPNTRGIRNDVVAALKALKVPNVRWPGGCFADEYHWRKGIGPLQRASGHAEPELGRRHRAEHVRHARVPRLHRSDRQRGLPFHQPWLGDATGSGGVAGVPDGGAADGARQGARRQRP